MLLGCNMIQNGEVSEGLLEYFKEGCRALEAEKAIGPGNFGDWCRYDSNVFCQEREGCANCLKNLDRLRNP